MHKPLALSLAVCLGFTGCQVFQKSPAWEEATNVRPGETIKDPDPSHAYSQKLHHALASHGIEHKVVTYQYRYTTRLREEAIGTRTAVVYRDNSSGNYPWWLKDERLNTPFWLPNGSLDRQISFYLQRQVSVIEKKDFSGHGDGKDFKSTVAFRTSAPTPRTLVAARPAPAQKIAWVKPAVSKPGAKPSTRVAAVRKPVQPQISHKYAGPHQPATHVVYAPAKVAPAAHVAAKSAPARREETESTAAHGFWSAPTVLDPVAQAHDPIAQDSSLARLFRQRNGGKFDPSSPADRRKMEQLKHGLSASRE